MRSLWIALVLCASGCAPEESRALYELERLTFVPASEYALRPDRFPPILTWDLSLSKPILIDVFEVTRRDLEAYAEIVEARGELSAELPRPALDQPVGLTYDQAQELAALRSMRLPTAIEWIHVSLGRKDLGFPWGQDQSSVSNTLETGVGRPTDVGTFENGRSIPFGCYDLVGNVWEWVSTAVPGYEDVADEKGDLLRVEGPMVMGGAFDSPRRPTYEWYRGEHRYRFHGIYVAPDELRADVGARMCADATSYLWEKADEWGTGEEVRARVVEVGRRWSRDPMMREGLRSVLAELRAREGAPEGLDWLMEGVATPPQ